LKKGLDFATSEAKIPPIIAIQFIFIVLVGQVVQQNFWVSGPLKGAGQGIA
jgi:hypothetical protein